jgi:hypothetical protein
VIDVAIKLFLLTIATEAIVELWRKAAPLQGIRERLIALTPFLYSKRQNTHLLDCGYCLSVWAAGMSLGILWGLGEWPLIVIVVHRVSNYAHLAYSLMRDLQLDVRVARGKK